MIKFQSINEKLIVIVSLTMILITAVTNIYSWSNGLSRIRDEMDEKLYQELELARGALEYPIWDLNYEATNSIIEAVIHKPSVVSILVLSPNGDFIAGIKKDNFIDDTFTQSRKVIHDNQYIGLVEISMTDQYVKEDFIRIRLVDLQLVLLQMLVVILIIHFFMYKELSPLLELENVASNIANGDFDNLILKKASHQVKKLQEAVYKMQAGLIDKENRIKDQIDQLEEAVKNTNTAYKDTVLGLAKSVEINDTYTGGHCERVAFLSKRIAQVLNLDQEAVDDIEIAAILHDIGKIGISASILNKPGRLTEEEYIIVKTHSQKGYDILNNISFLNTVSQHVLMHHERVDGKGYPNGRSGDDISLGAKIISVADSYDAMTSKRSYREKVMTMDEAISELRRNSGSQFDPLVVDVFVKLLEGGVDIEFFKDES